jgi:general secretion pathway protein G
MFMFHVRYKMINGFTPHLFLKRKNTEYSGVYPALLLKKDRAGFTLIELLVVISIIRLLATFAVVSLNNARKKSNTEKAKAELKQIHTAIQLLGNDTGEWPGHQDIEVTCGSSCGGGNEVWDLNSESAGITQNDSANPYSNWGGPYMVIVPKDPWGNYYFFDSDYDLDPAPGNQNDYGAVVGSFGQNGEGQNVYDSDDIYLIIGF